MMMLCYNYNDIINILLMKNLSEKQNSFCAEYVANGYNGSKAYQHAYNQEDKNVAKAEAWKMLRLPHIQEGIKNAELDYRIEDHGIGINKVAILKVIKAAMNARKLSKLGEEEDYAAQLKAIEVYARLTGDFSAEKKNIVFDDSEGDKDISKMSKEEREAYKAKILAEL